MAYELSGREEAALRRLVRTGACAVPADELVRMVADALAACGPSSHGRKNALRLGKCFAGERARVVVPVCPDYGYDTDADAYRGLVQGVWRIAEQHVGFLEKVQRAVPHLHATFVLADAEYEDPVLCRAAGLSRDEFSTQVCEAVRATRERVHPFGWEAVGMRDLVPDMDERERAAHALITGNPALRLRLTHDTIAREDLYRRLDTLCSAAERYARTARTASQYVALGTFACDAVMAVCNHTTVNLSWYAHVDAALLHNPVLA